MWKWHMSKEPNVCEASSQQYLILTLQDNWPVPSSSDDKAPQTPIAPWPPGCNFEWWVWHLVCWVAQASAGRDPWAPGCNCTAAEPTEYFLPLEGGLEQWGGLSFAWYKFDRSSQCPFRSFVEFSGTSHWCPSLGRQVWLYEYSYNTDMNMLCKMWKINK